MDLAAELKKRLDYRKKVADELTALDNELMGVVDLLQRAAAQRADSLAEATEDTYTAGPNRLTDVTPAKPARRRAGGYTTGVTAAQIEAYLIKRVDKPIDVEDLVTRFGMKRNSATTRLWNLAHSGRIVKTGPGTYYVPAPRNGSLAEAG